MTTLQDLATLPGAQLLIQSAKAGTYVEGFTDLFEWILNGDPNTKFPLDKTELIRNVIKYSNDSKIRKQILAAIQEKLKQRVDIEQLKLKAKLIRLINDLLFNDSKLRIIFSREYPVSGRSHTINAARIILSTKQPPTHYLAEYIANPDVDIAIADLVNSDFLMWIGVLYNSLREYLGENIDKFAKLNDISVEQVALNQLLDLYNQATNGKYSETIQNIVKSLLQVESD